MNKNPERIFVAFIISSILGLVIAHSVNILLEQWLHTSRNATAIQLSLLVIFVSIAFALCQYTIRKSKIFIYTSVIIPILVALSAAAFGNVLGTTSLTVVLVGIIQTYTANLMFSRLPLSLNSVLSKYPLRSLMWAILSVLLLVQTGRLSTYMADTSYDWWLTTKNEWWAKHMCMPAYIQAADYNRQGEVNVYDVRHYPAITREAKLHITVQQLDAFVGDPYQYPPQFLIAPSIALWLTNDFLKMRTLWYCLQVLGFVLVAVLLARWIRPEIGWSAMLLIPLVWISVPAMQCFQYGQFHLATIILAIAGMLAFEHQRRLLGGLLLAIAILSKLFPAILLIPMVVQRRWKDLTWTVVFGTAITLLALVIIGPKPFTAFAGYQIPRLSNGSVMTAFTKEWPEFREMLIANVISLYGVVFKLRELGIGGMSAELALWIMRVYSVLLIFIALAAGKVKYSPLGKAYMWLALLNLAALQASIAWGDYVTVGSVWLLSLMTVQAYQNIWRRLLLGLCWAFTVLDLGIVPMPTLPPVEVMMIVTIISAFLLHIFNVWILLGMKKFQNIISA